MCNKDLQYLKKCLASSGEISIYDEQTNKTVTYTKHNGKMVMKSDSGKCIGEQAAISFLSSKNNPFAKATVTKEGETCINTKFLSYLNQIEEDYIENT